MWNKLEMCLYVTYKSSIKDKKYVKTKQITSKNQIIKLNEQYSALNHSYEMAS